MALIFSSSTVTNTGDSAIASAIGGQTLTVTRIAVGSGQLSGSQTPQTQTSLVTQQMSLLSPTLINNNNGQIVVNAVLDSANVGASFSLTELGVYGRIGTGAEQLLTYAVAQTPFQFIQFATGVSDAQISVSVPIQVGSVPSQNITVVLGGQSFNAPVVKGIAPVVVTPVTNSGGVITEYDVSVNSNVQQVINSNINLFVLTTANNVYPNFTSIQNALNWLMPYTIQSGFFVTINVAAGIYNSATQILINHPQGQSIKIIGSVGPTVTTTAATMAAQIVTLTGSFSASGIVAGDYVIASCSNTVNGITESGIHKVNAVSGTALTFTASGGGTISLTGSTFSVFKLQSVLTFAAGISGISIQGNGIGLIQSLAVVGTASGSITISGISVSNSALATVNTVGVTNWLDSSNVSSNGFIATSGGQLTCQACYSNGNSNGYISLGYSSNIQSNSSFCNFNVKVGFWADQSSIAVNSSNCMGNGYAGAFAIAGNIGIAGTGFNCAYNAVGLYAQANASIIVSTSGAAGVNGNTTDIVLQIISSIFRSTGPTIAWASKSTNIVAANQLTADGCYFSP